MATKRNAKEAQLLTVKGAMTPQPQKGVKTVNKGPSSEPPAKKKPMLEAADDSDEEIEFDESASTKLFVAASAADSKDKDVTTEEEDRRTLFVGNITDQVKEEDLMKLSPDIIEVRLRFRAHRRRREVKLMHYAYMVFKSEEMAEKNYKKLQDAKFKSSVLRVDYVGSKRQHGKEVNKESETALDKTRLYVSGLSTTTSESDLKKMFPTATEVSIPRHRTTQQHYGFGFVQFANEALSKAAMEKVQGKITVAFARAKNKTQKTKSNQKKHKSDSEESDEDDDDEDDDDDDDDDDIDDDDDDDDDDEEEDDEEDEH